jgi:ABC-2 type transport system ATP-binding protein
MEEAEICDRIAIIDHGRIIALDTPSGLKSMVGGDVVTIRTSDNDAARGVLLARHGLEARDGHDDTIVVESENGDRLIPAVLASLGNGNGGLEVQSVSLARPTLEDVFLKLTGRTIRDEEARPTERLKQQTMGRRGH